MPQSNRLLNVVVDDRQQITHPTAIKIRELREMPVGWFYGTGVAPDEEVVDITLKLNRAAINESLFETDVFPAEGGELMLVIYYDNYCLELMVERDGRINVVYERNDEEFDFKENLSLKEAVTEIRLFRKQVWNLSDSFIGNISIDAKGTFAAQPFRTPVITQESQSLTESAQSFVAEQFASIFGVITPLFHWADPPLSIGASS